MSGALGRLTRAEGKRLLLRINYSLQNGIPPTVEGCSLYSIRSGRYKHLKSYPINPPRFSPFP